MADIFINNIPRLEKTITKYKVINRFAKRILQVMESAQVKENQI